MESGTLQGLIKKNGLPEEVAVALGEEPFKITTITQFANFFESKAEVDTAFCKASQAADKVFKNRGDLVAGIKQAWREAEAITARTLKRTIEEVNIDTLDEPLKHDEQVKLETTFKLEYKMAVPPLWMGFPAMLGRFHREFLRRNHTVFHVNKVRNLEAVVLQGSSVKHQKLGALDIAFGESTRQAEAPVGNIFSYILGLKAVLYTMGMAGTFKVQRSQGAVYFAPLEGLLNHLAAVEGYVLRHSSGKDARPEHVILKQLTTIDEGVRGEWARVLRANEPDGVTLGEAIQATSHFAAGMFLMAPPMDQPRKPTFEYSQSPNRNSKGAGKSDFKGNKADRKGESGPRRSFPDENLAEKFDLRYKTCRFSEQGRKLCKPYNDVRGCKNPTCQEEHRCDILTPKGVACGGSHPRMDHKGPKVPL